MPIKLNLLAEVQAQEEMRRKDPVKFAIFGGALLVVIMLVWFSATALSMLSTSSALNNVKAKIAAHTNDLAVVKLNQKRMDDSKRRLDELDKLSNARFLQGRLLDALQQVYVPNVAMLRVKVNQTFAVKEGGTMRSGAKAPSSVVESTTLLIDAKDLSPNPGDQVNRFKDGISRLELLKPAKEANGIHLAGAPTAPHTGTDGKNFVQFTLECHYPDITR